LIVGGIIYFRYFYLHEISITLIKNNPQLYDSVKVKLKGVVLEFRGAFWGPKYWLVEITEENIKNRDRIALASTLDLSEFVSYVSDDANYTLISYKSLIVTGTVKYVGMVTDAPPFHLQLESIVFE